MLRADRNVCPTLVNASSVAWQVDCGEARTSSPMLPLPHQTPSPAVQSARYRTARAVPVLVCKRLAFTVSSQANLQPNHLFTVRRTHL